MAQLTFSDFEKDLQRKKSRKAEFLELLDRLVPWASLIALIEPYYPKVPDGSGRRPYALDSMIRIYIMQLCYNLSDPMMENELIDSVAKTQDEEGIHCHCQISNHRFGIQTLDLNQPFEGIKAQLNAIANEI